LPVFRADFLFVAWSWCRDADWSNRKELKVVLEKILKELVKFLLVQLYLRTFGCNRICPYPTGTNNQRQKETDQKVSLYKGKSVMFTRHSPQRLLPMN
jgi:5-methylthioribose kinase